MLYPSLSELLSLKKQYFSPFWVSKLRKNLSSTGNHHTAFRGRGLDFDSVRHYVPGDDIRIDWKVTARTNIPHLKVFREERERQFLICIDVNSSMRFGTKNTFKSVQAARAASYLAWSAMAMQDKVSACLFGDVLGGIQFFPSTKNKTSITQWLRILTEPPAESHPVSLEMSLEYVAEKTRSGSIVFFITDFMTCEPNSLITSIAKLKKKADVFFIAINDPFDQQIYPMGIIEFSSRSEKVVIETDNAPARERYATEWEMQRGNLRQVCKQWRIPLLELMTSSDVCKELRQMQRRK